SPGLKADFIRRVEEYADFMTACLARTAPGIRPMLAHAQWAFRDQALYLTAESKACREYLEETRVPERLVALMQDVFRLEAQVVLQEAADQQAQLRRLERLREEAVREAELQSVQAQKEKKPAKPQNKVYGSSIAEPVLPINELTMESGRVTICGEVLDAESRELKGGEMKLLSFSVTDLTGTMPCKVFLRYRRRGSGEGSGPPTPEEIARVEAVIAAVEAGAYLKVRGDCQWDKFRNETCLMVNDINLAQKPVREDLGEEKRVELHLHTQM
ncbi:MAG TPA: hypothetical protein PKE04_23485, partial [Clostridia bacterium]|nr:hypothetical protein [Clostridia bacterium]